MQQQLQAFRQATRQLALHTIPTRLHHLFKGQNQVKGKRLASLAIATHIAILPWQSCHTQQTRERLAQEVLRSQHRLSQAKDTQAIADYQHMPIRQIQLKGRTRWSSTIRRCTHPLYIHTTATAGQLCPCPGQAAWKVELVLSMWWPVVGQWWWCGPAVLEVELAPLCAWGQAYHWSPQLHVHCLASRDFWQSLHRARWSRVVMSKAGLVPLTCLGHLGHVKKMWFGRLVLGSSLVPLLLGCSVLWLLVALHEEPASACPVA